MLLWSREVGGEGGVKVTKGRRVRDVLRKGRGGNDDSCGRIRGQMPWEEGTSLQRQ